MARPPRIDVAGFPQHIIQRGNNRQACFFASCDNYRYLSWLRQSAEKYSCAVHTYVLMTNHVHLLATGAEKGAVGLMMQSLGRRYVRYVNDRYGRSGTLWEGRYRSSLVDTEHYLLTCYRYIELNPVRAFLVKSAAEYQWSSYHHNARGHSDDLITHHVCYKNLGRTNKERQSSYRRLFEKAIDEDDLNAIRSHTNQGKALGSNQFVKHVASILKRPVHFAKRGRPKKYSDPFS